MTDPTQQQADAACQAAWPDYATSVGIARQAMRDTAIDWLRVWQSAGVDPLAKSENYQAETGVAYGNAPNVPLKTLMRLRGQYCAVEYGTRRLLGSNKDERVLRGFMKSCQPDKKWYVYPVPSDLKVREKNDK